jgi:hypothetical protein
MRWMQTVELVRWCRNDPKSEEVLSGDVGLVRWCRNGMWDETWDPSIAIVQHAGTSRLPDTSDTPDPQMELVRVVTSSYTAKFHHRTLPNS